MVIVICNDGEQPGKHVAEFTSLDEAESWIDTQLVIIEGVGERTRKMYRVFVGEEIAPIERDK